LLRFIKHTTLFFVRGSKSSENHGSYEHSWFFGSLPVAFPKGSVLGPPHGYGIARRIEQISGDLLAVNQGRCIPGAGMSLFFVLESRIKNG
jgi:hypothetical protein